MPEPGAQGGEQYDDRYGAKGQHKVVLRPSDLKRGGATPQETKDHGGTFPGHSVSMAAADKTLQVIDETDVLQTIENCGLQLQEGLGQILKERDIPHSFTGHPALMGLFFSDEPPFDYRGWVDSDYAFYDALAPELHEQGILVEPDSREPWFLCEAHAEGCLEETLDKFTKAVDITMSKLEATPSLAGTA